MHDRTEQMQDRLSQDGVVRYAPVKSLWLTSMALSAIVGGAMTYSWACLILFIVTTGVVVLFGATLGIHRKLIHDSYLWGGWGFVFWGVCARITATVCGFWLTSFLAHRHGAMHFHIDGAGVQGKNVPLASLLTMGECWHNNHHAFPGSAKYGLYPGEWDPGWWVLNLLHRCGLVWDLRVPEQLPTLPEPVRIGMPAQAS